MIIRLEKDLYKEGILLKNRMHSVPRHSEPVKQVQGRLVSESEAQDIV